MNIDFALPFSLVAGFRPLRGLHIGHYAGVVTDLVKFQYVRKGTVFAFIADHHARSRWDARVDFANVRKRSSEIARQLVSLGVDPGFAVIYRQSDLPELFELMWFLAGLTTDGRLRRGHAMEASTAPSVGVYLYPLLMVADILSIRATHVAIGSDQMQHLELSRDLARKLVGRFGPEFVPIPESIRATPLLVQGINSTAQHRVKMDAEKENDIPIFADEETIEDRIDHIITHSVKWGEPLPTSACNILDFVGYVCGENSRLALSERYGSGEIGYADAKKLLRDSFFDHFAQIRQRYRNTINEDVDEILALGAHDARHRAASLLRDVRSEVATSI